MNPWIPERRTRSLMLAPTMLGLLCIGDLARGQETDGAIIGTAIRREGFECTEPVQVERDPEASSADEQAWLAHCANADYRVKFMGDTKPAIERLS